MLIDNRIICMNVSPDGSVIIGTNDESILVYSESFEKISEKFLEFTPDAYIQFSPSGSLIILCMAKSIKMLDNLSAEVLFEIETSTQTLQTIMTCDERYLIIALDNGHIGFFDFMTEDYLTIKVHESSISSIHFNTDLNLIYSFGSDSKLSLLRFPRLTMFKSSTEINFPFNAVLINSRSNDVTEIPSVLNKARKERKERKEETFKPLCMAQSEKKDLIIVGGESDVITIWDRDTIKKTGDLRGHTGNVYSLASLNDDIVASGSADTKVILWNYRKLKKISILAGHTDAVSAVVKIDTDRLASGSWDKTIRI